MVPMVSMFCWPIWRVVFGPGELDVGHADAGRIETSPNAAVAGAWNSFEPNMSNSTTAFGVAPPMIWGPRTEKLSRVWRRSKPKTGLSASYLPATNRAFWP